MWFSFDYRIFCLVGKCSKSSSLYFTQRTYNANSSSWRTRICFFRYVTNKIEAFKVWKQKERKRKYATFTEELGSNNKYRINLTNRLTFGNNISHFFHFFGRRNFFPKKAMTLPLFSAGIKVIRVLSNFRS